MYGRIEKTLPGLKKTLEGLADSRNLPASLDLEAFLGDSAWFFGCRRFWLNSELHCGMIRKILFLLSFLSFHALNPDSD